MESYTDPLKMAMETTLFTKNSEFLDSSQSRQQIRIYFPLMKKLSLTKTKKIHKSLVMKKKHTTKSDTVNIKTREKKRKTPTQNTLKRRKKVSESTLSKKDFREHPSVEKLYKNIYEYRLREEAYKTVLEIYINLLLKEK